MLFFLYLKEIRFRIFYCFVSLVYSWFICFFFIEELTYLFIRPLQLISSQINEKVSHFIFTNLGDAFFSFFNFALFLGLLMSLYFFIFQFFCYIVPSLFLYEKNILMFLILFSLLALIISLHFWYSILLPTLCNFFLSFELVDADLPFEILFEGKIDEYFLLVTKSLSGLIMVFQFPILLFSFIILDFFNISFLVEYRKIIYFIFVFISALVTPPDVISQLFFILPFILFYEFVILSIFFFNEYY